jgi:hypothetical protein
MTASRVNESLRRVSPALGAVKAGPRKPQGSSDGRDEGRCGDENVLATATPGSRLVAVCGRFTRAYREDRTWAEIVLIHEALHTLGLGENPPTSAEISIRVAARCR